MKYFYEGEWRELPNTKTPIVDSLDSDNAEAALSAKQGKILNEKIEGLSVEETDPTVPAYVKSISEEDIQKWNTGITEEEIAAMGYVKFEKADSEEDAETKSKQNPNVVYY